MENKDEKNVMYGLIPEDFYLIRDSCNAFADTILDKLRKDYPVEGRNLDRNDQARWRTLFEMHAWVVAETTSSYRRCSLRDYICSQGLKENLNTIIDDLNRSSNPAQIDDLFNPGVTFRSILDYYPCMNLYTLERGKKFVDRWKMYNELFGEQED